MGRPAPTAPRQSRARRAPPRSAGSASRCDRLAPGGGPRSLRQAGRDRWSGRPRRRGRPPRVPGACRRAAGSWRGSPRRWRGRWEARLVRSLSEVAGRPSSRYRTPTLSIAGLPADRLRPWLSLLALALLVKGVLVTLTLIEFGATPDPLTALGQAWDQWDARHYIYLATHGYGAAGDARNLIAFFPLYPALISAVSAVGLPARTSALLISNVAGGVAGLLLSAAARADGYT